MTNFKEVTITGCGYLHCRPGTSLKASGFFIISHRICAWFCGVLLGFFGTMMTSSNGNFSALLTLCAGNSQVTGEFPTQRTVTRSFGIFFDLRLNKRLSKQSWGWWFATTLRSWWRHSNPYMRQLNGSVSIQVMDCRLFGAKRLPETILTCYQLGPW